MQFPVVVLIWASLCWTGYQCVKEEGVIPPMMSEKYIGPRRTTPISAAAILRSVLLNQNEDPYYKCPRGMGETNAYMKTHCIKTQDKIICQVGRFNYVIDTRQFEMRPDTLQRFVAMINHRATFGDKCFCISVDTRDSVEETKPRCKGAVRTTTEAEYVTSVNEEELIPVTIECESISNDPLKMCNPSYTPTEHMFKCKVTPMGIRKRRKPSTFYHLSVHENGTVKFVDDDVGKIQNKDLPNIRTKRFTRRFLHRPLNRRSISWKERPRHRRVGGSIDVYGPIQMFQSTDRPRVRAFKDVCEGETLPCPFFFTTPCGGITTLPPEDRFRCRFKRIKRLHRLRTRGGLLLPVQLKTNQEIDRNVDKKPVCQTQAPKNLEPPEEHTPRVLMEDPEESAEPKTMASHYGWQPVSPDALTPNSFEDPDYPSRTKTMGAYLFGLRPLNANDSNIEKIVFQMVPCGCPKDSKPVQDYSDYPDSRCSPPPPTFICSAGNTPGCPCNHGAVWPPPPFPCYPMTTKGCHQCSDRPPNQCQCRCHDQHVTRPCYVKYPSRSSCGCKSTTSMCPSCNCHPSFVSGSRTGVAPKKRLNSPKTTSAMILQIHQ